MFSLQVDSFALPGACASCFTGHRWVQLVGSSKFLDLDLQEKSEVISMQRLINGPGTRNIFLFLVVPKYFI